VVRHPSLRKIVGTDTFTSVSGSDLELPLCRDLAMLFLLALSINLARRIFSAFALFLCWIFHPGRRPRFPLADG